MTKDSWLRNYDDCTYIINNDEDLMMITQMINK